MNVVLISSSYPPPLQTSDSSDDETARKGPIFLQGGIAVHVGRLADALVARKINVTVFAWSPLFDDISIENGVTVCRISSRNRKSTSAYPDADDLEVVGDRFAARAIELCCGTYKPDVIHCHHSSAFAAAKGLGVQTGAKVISTAHVLMSSPDFPGSNPYQSSARLTESSMFQDSAHVIAVSRWLRCAILQEHPIHADRISVIYSGLRAPISTVSEAAGKEWRQQFKVNGKHLITYTGRLTEEKGIREFLSIAQLILTATSDVAFAIAGGYEDEVSNLKHRVLEDRLLRDHVFALGWLDNAHLDVIRSISAVVVVPSLYEPFGYAALEAMASGIPVVCTDAGGLAEIVEDGITGFVVPLIKERSHVSVNTKAVATRILDLLGDTASRRRMSEKARERVITRFSEGAMMDRILDLYCSATPLHHGQTHAGG